MNYKIRLETMTAAYAAYCLESGHTVVAREHDGLFAFRGADGRYAVVERARHTQWRATAADAINEMRARGATVMPESGHAREDVCAGT